MNINYLILGVILFFIIFSIYGSYKSINKIKEEKKEKEVILKKYGSVTKHYISEDLQDPILVNYCNLTDSQINDIQELWKICFPHLINDKKSIEKGFSDDSLLWILNDVKTKRIKGFICGLESIEFIQYLNSKGIEDLDFYSIRNWNGIFINNLCISPEYRKKGWANKLIQEVVSWAHENKKDYLHLLLDSDNKIAFKLYIKNKFQIDNESINPDTQKEVYTMLRLINSNKINNETEDYVYNSESNYAKI